MATSDWSSAYTDRTLVSGPASASLSPIPVSTGSPPDSGNSSPNSPAFAQDVSISKPLRTFFCKSDKLFIAEFAIGEGVVYCKAFFYTFK